MLSHGSFISVTPPLSREIQCNLDLVSRLHPLQAAPPQVHCHSKRPEQQACQKATTTVASKPRKQLPALCGLQVGGSFHA
mmetsp:Transcript_20214/g.56335  ORF Transcript_20214/g.56335 Transcript_20214/m.56335 type:complete len:80 (-) Transcript_20214:1567-1806(-)